MHRLVAELKLDPWLACQRLLAQPHVLFLDSALRHPSLGRYSYVMAAPRVFLKWRQGRWSVAGEIAEEPRLALTKDPFSTLQQLLRSQRRHALAGLPPFQGGWAGLFGYELCHVIERLPRPKWDEFRLPDMAVGLYDWVYGYDHHQERGWVIVNDSDQNRAGNTLREVAQCLSTDAAIPRFIPGPALPRESLALQYPLGSHQRVTSNFARNDFESAIARAIRYVEEGDVFQVNVAQRLLHPLEETAAMLYGRLRERNPAPFAGYFDLGEATLLSASPERFLQVEPTGHVETRPIKGTRPRRANAVEDRRQREELLASAKDRAENVMIVDLLRNDLGRVCDYGTVQVSDLCKIESYQTVHHLVSVVEGELAKGKDAVDLLRASFPGGSVTGAPKVRAMEIIAELEPTVRGPYCGSLGYLGYDGAMDTNILIRTFTAAKGWLQFPVGGGIVADSLPEQEYQETLHKAAGLLRALEP